MVKKYAKKITAIMAAVTIIFSMLLYFPSGTFSNISFGLKASAAEITVSQPKVGDGTSDSPYQIRTAAELYWFAGLVNGTLEGVDRNASASAVLTADITVNSNLLNSLNDDGTVPDGTAVTSWTPINNFSLGEAGTFDGQNHTISGLYFNDTSTSNVGLFGVNKGTIKNVGVVDSYFRGKNCVGGVCGENDDTITNCYNTGTVSGSDKVGGVCGYNCFGTITNCYNTETVSGSDSVGGVCGYNYGKITNCYYDSNKYSGNAVGSDKGTVTGVNGKTTAQFNSGEVAYLLSQGCTIGETTYDGSIWGQEIGTDPYPVLGGAKVYGYYEPSTDDNGVYQIGTVAQLYWFADKVNNDNENFGSASAVLTADITVNTGVLKSDGTLADDTSNFRSWTPIGNESNPYTGTFDGQGHTVSGLYFNDSSTSYVGLFGVNNGTLKNVGVVDSYFSGESRVGGVCGENNGTITNCYNTGTVSGTNSYAGGVCGRNESGKITGCYNTGTVKGSGNYIGGVCGANDFRTITGCYNTGEVKGGNYVGGVCGVNFRGAITGCYNTGTVSGDSRVGGVCGWNLSGKITGCCTNNKGICGDNQSIVTDCEQYDDVCFKDGTVCKLLNTALQNANADVCFYQGANYPVLIVIPNLPKLVEGVYQISNKQELCAFAQLVNSGAEPSANAVLTADITVNTGVLKADGTLADDTSNFTSWTPIGNSSQKYTGTFDGQNHTISGLYFNDKNTNYVGLFGYNSGTVKNVGVVDSYFKGNWYVGGVCGTNAGTITSCYNTGAVSGSDRVGGVSGYNNSEGTIISCYSKGTVSSTDDFVGGVCGYNLCKITNCYYGSDKYSGNAVGYNNGTVTDVEGKTTAQFASGKVAYLLSQDKNGGIWGQKIGTDPYPVLNGKKVLANVDCSAFANDIIVYGQSASLDGTIGFNIYVSADDSYEWDKTVNGVQGVEIENGLYKFTYQVAAKDMDKKINFTVNDKIDVTVSVSDYLTVLSETDNAFLKNLAASMSDYGDAAEAYFSGEAVAEQTVTDDLSVYDFTVGTMPEGISYYGSSLILKSETTIRHYFKLAEGKEISDYTFSVDGTTVTPTEKQGYYCIDIKNVRAEKLGTSFNVSVNGEEVITNYSALSYVYKVMESDSTDDNLKNLVKALYIYNRNALTYINAA